MENEPIKAEYNRRPDGTFGEGNLANPLGRPKGQTLKEWRRQKLAEMTDQERLDFLEKVAHIDQWRMAEGNPDTHTDLTTKGEKIELTGKLAELAKQYEQQLNNLDDSTGTNINQGVDKETPNQN